MADKYENPPIEEAICELHFEESSHWDQTYPGLIYSKVSEKGFPKKREAEAYGLDEGTEKEQPALTSETRQRFFSESEKSLIQVGRHFLSINRLRPYQGWEDFKNTISEGFDSYSQVANPDGIKSISIRYINKVNIDKEQDVSEFFDMSISLGDDLPNEYSSFIAGIVKEYDQQDALKIQLTSSGSESPDQLGILFELDYFLADPDSFDISETLKWVETAHERVEEVFEAAITEELREQFGRKESDNS